VTLELSRAHSRLLLALRRAPGAGRFVLVGAAALKHHVLLPRTTEDVDLALVAEPEEMAGLFGSLGWHPDERQAQRWRDDAGHRIDVLPATDRIIEAGTLLLDGDTRRMSMAGFDLALANTVSVDLPGEEATVEVASLAALVVLKMVAWMDRPHERLRDLGDLARVFALALDDTDVRRWKPPLSEVDFDEQSPFSVGLEVAAIWRRSHRLVVGSFVAKIQDESLAWAAVMAREGGYVGRDPEGLVRRRLAAFERGLAAKLSS
jgi:predicted nucleotidyltransferase